MPKVRWYCCMGFVANFIRFPAVQKVWKSVKIWQSYREYKGGNFFLRHSVVHPKASWAGISATSIPPLPVTGNHRVVGKIPDQPQQGIDGYGGKDFDKRKLLRREWKTQWEVLTTSPGSKANDAPVETIMLWQCHHSWRPSQSADSADKNPGTNLRFIC